MSRVDRVGRSLFVALAVGLAWGIRGDFGHLVGAMYPGAVLALALAYVSGRRSMFLWMPVLAALSAAAIGSGGTMSYGILHGYAQADTLVNYGYGFLTLFLQGSAWGAFGGALIGLMMERKPMRTGEWFGLIGSVLFGGWVVSFLAVDVLGFQINPPRNNGSIAYMGAALGQLVWLATHDKPVGLRGAVLGYVGFGLGMAVGRLLGNTANVLQTLGGFTINHWNVMETSCGFIGGFIYTYGMVDVPCPEPPDGEDLPLASAYGVVYVLGLIPLWHRVNRINPPEKLAEWTKTLTAYHYADPGRLAGTVLWLIDGLCVLGFVGAAVWAVVQYRKASRWAALPVLWLSTTMVLFQNLNALYFFYPIKPGLVNMHTVFWLMLALMAVYVAVARPGPAVVSKDELPQISLMKWAAGTSAALALVILLAGFVNGEQTMKSDCTRWPQWTWSQGPFPGR
jgi:hypothetical protein